MIESWKNRVLKRHGQNGQLMVSLFMMFILHGCSGITLTEQRYKTSNIIVEFGNLTRSEPPFIDLKANVEADLYVHGNVLIGGLSTIITLNSTASSILAGGTFGGYANGQGSEVRMGYAFIHQLSKQTVLFSDYFNHCIRKLEREDNTVEDYAGNCTEQGELDGIGKEARLTNPMFMASDHHSANYALVYILTRYGQGLRRINTLDRQVDTITSLSKRGPFISIWADPYHQNKIVLGTSENLYRTDWSLSSTEDFEVVKLAVSNITYVTPVHEDLYVAAGGPNNGLYIADTKTDKEQKICDLTSATDKSLSECFIYPDNRFTMAHDHLYLVSGAYLKYLPMTIRVTIREQMVGASAGNHPSAILISIVYMIQRKILQAVF